MNPVLLLTVLQHLTERLLLRSVLKNASLSVPVVLFLLRIAERPGITRIEIERELGIGSCSGQQAVKWLLESGLIVITPAEDRKSKKISLSAEGHAVLEGLDEITLDTERPDDVFRVPSSMKKRTALPTE
jgi:DNA-binding MarR family transcriptional regulator